MKNSLRARLGFMFVVIMLIAAGCKSAPPLKTSEDFTEGQWRAKALIKDLQQNRSYIVNLNFNVQKDINSRMDVTTALGTGVASLLVNPKEVRYVLFDQHRFYYGAPQPSAMRPILAIPFDPRWIQNLLLDIPITDPSWTCSNDDKGFLAECADTTNGLKVTWSARQGSNKTILISHAKATVQINVKSYRPKVEDRKNLFVLDAPESYQKLKVR